MGLVAWYPLNGTGESKGLVTNKFSISDTEYGNDGKIGKYYLTSNKWKSTGEISEIQNFKKISIAFWFKENKIDTTAWQDFMKFYVHYDDGEKVTNGDFRLEQHTSGDKTQVYADWYCNVTSTSYPSYTGAAAYSNSPKITDLEWHHAILMLDFENRKCVSYFDGVLNKTSNINSNAKYVTGNLYIGDSNIDAGICDLRVYNHLLSNKEIKDLYNCLILHYPLNSGYGNENLLTGTYEGCTGAGTLLTDEAYNGFKIRYLKYEGTSYKDCVSKSSAISPTTDTYYTISFWGKGNCEIYNYFYPNTCASGISSDGHTTTSLDGRCSISLTSEWQRYWVTWKTRSDVSGAKNIIVGRIQNQGTGAECYIAGLKLEKGDQATHWCPNSADTLYTTLGYNNTVEYDTSGFGNDGIKIGSIESVSDSPIGSGSYYLASNVHIKTKDIVHPSNGITLSVWYKGKTGGRFGCWESGGAGICIKNGKWRADFFINNKYNTIYGDNAKDGWQFVAARYDGQTLSFFNDGVLINEIDFGAKYPIQWHTKTPWAINGNPSPDGSAITEGDNGYWSDARIYATALTNNEIKELYQVKSKIDKNGNIYCNEFVDDDDGEELLTTQKMTLHQQNAQATISYETNGQEIINIVTVDDNASGWRYLFNTAFDKQKILNRKLKFSFKYKSTVVKDDNIRVTMCKGDSTKSQPTSTDRIYPKTTEWQEYNGIITFGETYDNQGLYIHFGIINGGTFYVKDLSLKIYNGDKNIDFTKKSQVVSKELSELDSNKALVYKNNKIIANQIIEN